MTADLRCCTAAELAAALEPGSVDAVICDPPYPREFLPTWSDLGALAARVLVPGGALVAMSGQVYLPEVLARVGEHLTYRWALACMTPGANGRIWPRHLYIGWKPILWWTNGDGPATPRRWIEDRVVSKPDKRFHGWGQDLGVFRDLIGSFSSYGELVCDPFVGGGTTAAAAMLEGRRFVGCDIDEASVRKTAERVRAVEEYLRTQRALVEA